MNLTQQLRSRTTYLTTTELKDLLRVRRNTIVDWIKRGNLHAILTPSGYRFDPEVIADWLDARLLKAAPT